MAASLHRRSHVQARPSTLALEKGKLMEVADMLDRAKMLREMADTICEMAEECWSTDLAMDDALEWQFVKLEAALLEKARKFDVLAKVQKKVDDIPF